MKRLFLTFACLLALVCVRANEAGHFFVDLSAQRVPVNNIAESFGSYFSFANGSTFELFRDTTDGLGIRHQSYQQMYQGTKVLSHIVLVHSANGLVTCINGSVMEQSQVPSSSPARIRPQENAGATVIFGYRGVYYTAYKMYSRQTAEILYVDAATGEIICRESIFRHADVPGRGYTHYNGWQNMTVFEENGQYYLLDMGRNILTMSADSVSPNLAYFLSAEYIGTHISADILANLANMSVDEQRAVYETYVYGPMLANYIQDSCKAVVSNDSNFYTHGAEAAPLDYADVHWGMQKTLDFYREVFGRNSFDGKGHIVINLVFPPKDALFFSTLPNNAAAQDKFEPYFMFYGKGDDSTMSAVTALDVMAHEYTHMVTGTNGNGSLDYLDEPGALNESFSDIMAMGVMQYTYDSCSWQIGADVTLRYPNMRSMYDPKNSMGAAGNPTRGAQPDTYKGECWCTSDTMSRVVHLNSGVQNYWFYLISEGGTGTNDYNNAYDVTGIGMDKALQIAFRNLLFYLAPNATFEDSRNGSVQAAVDLYGKASQAHRSVADAWYAVGVGDPYDVLSVPRTEAVPQVQKFVRDGQVLIRRNGTTYDVLGHRMP